MMIGILGPMTLCKKDQGTYTRSKVKHNKKETLCSTTLKEEDEEDELVEAKDRSSIITAHNQDTLQWIVKTLVPLAATATRLTML